jgi:hypothetical protein
LVSTSPVSSTTTPAPIVSLLRSVTTISRVSATASASDPVVSLAQPVMQRSSASACSGSSGSTGARARPPGTGAGGRSCMPEEHRQPAEQHPEHRRARGQPHRLATRGHRSIVTRHGPPT